MNRTFKADGAPIKHVLYGVKLLVPLAALIAAQIAFGWPGWLTTWAGAVVGCAVTALAFIGRSAWGDQVELRPESLIISKAGKERFHISSKTITALRAKADSIAIAWQDADRRKSVVIGSERFVNQSWEQLCAALSSLPIGNSDGSSQPRGA